jgi:hypothetical protein
MKTSEVLELAKTRLIGADIESRLNNQHPFICKAVNQVHTERRILEPDAFRAVEAILTGIHKIYPYEVVLIIAARRAGLVRFDASTHQPDYIEFRDKWLNDLIAELKAKGD